MRCDAMLCYVERSLPVTPPPKSCLSLDLCPLFATLRSSSLLFATLTFYEALYLAAPYSVRNTCRNSSAPLLSSFSTGLTSSRYSSSIVATDAVSDDSDDEDVEYKGHFCSGCSIPPPGGVRAGSTPLIL